jgi:Rab-like protein 2
MVLIGNKIDLDKKSVERKYKLVEQLNCPFYFVSAADGTNVVRVYIM